MLKSELIEQAEKLRSELWEKSRECRSLKENLEEQTKRSVGRLSSLRKVRGAIETVIAMRYPYQDRMPSALGAPLEALTDLQGDLMAEPEELCLLRHLYSLAQ
jgi:hypothetical protein